jgi:hypothetical protein
VKEISGRLEEYHGSRGGSRMTPGKDGDAGDQGVSAELHMPFFFSEATCKQMARDLKERVRTLAKVLIQTLQDG